MQEEYLAICMPRRLRRGCPYFYEGQYLRPLVRALITITVGAHYAASRVDSAGNPALCHARNPPWSAYTFSYPCSWSFCTKLAL